MSILWGTVNIRQKLIIILLALSMRENGAMGGNGLIVEESAYIHSVTCSTLFVSHHIFAEIQSGLEVVLGPSLVISQVQTRLPNQ